MLLTMDVRLALDDVPDKSGSSLSITLSTTTLPTSYSEYFQTHRINYSFNGEVYAELPN